MSLSSGLSVNVSSH